MADYKRYITQAQENGNVMISEDVVAAIVAHAAEEVEGITGLHAKKSWGKSIKIIIGEDNALSIHCSVVVSYGNSVIEVAAAAQQAITNAVEAMTGVKVDDVNINVSRISHQ